jgi:hypothetical protein
VTIAVSSTKHPSGYLRSASRTISSRPHPVSASQYAECCMRAFTKSGLPRFEVVIPSGKFLPGLRTIAFEYISNYWRIFIKSRIAKITLSGTAFAHRSFAQAGLTACGMRLAVMQDLKTASETSKISFRRKTFVTYRNFLSIDNRNQYHV